MKRILIIGATSAIATDCARLWAEQGSEFFLVARNMEKLEQTAADLKTRGANAVTLYNMDATVFSVHPAMLENCLAAMQQIDITLIAHGTLPDQKVCERDVTTAMRELANNGTSVIALLALLANQLETQRCGTLAVIGSVAGDRGRKSNYVYGAAKGLVERYVQGLQHRLASTGVKVVLIKPGPTDTPMTAHLKNTGTKLASVEQVARDIVRGIEQGRAVVYTPRIWAVIMLVIANLPRIVFNKMDI
jgi:decaprenylphospho-beta-D-erythro-pentofuranosid-2-ulose 2-reductase